MFINVYEKINCVKKLQWQVLRTLM